MKLDMLNSRILAALTDNCRTPYSALAPKLRTSREVLAYRIKSLIGEKVINGFTVVLDYSRMGYMVFKIYIHLKNPGDKALKELILYLQEMPNVSYCTTMLGSYDFCITFTSKKISELENFIDTINQKFSAIISKKSIVIVSSQSIIPESKLLISQKDASISQLEPKAEEIKLDAKDFALINRLVSDSTITLKELSRHTGIAIDTLKKRIKAMHKANIIKSFKASLNYAALGWKHYDMLIKTHPAVKSQKSMFFEFAKKHPNITYVSRTIGAYDFEFHIITRSQDEFEAVIGTIRENFGENIDSYIISEITKKVKVFPQSIE